MSFWKHTLRYTLSWRSYGFLARNNMRKHWCQGNFKGWNSQAASKTAVLKLCNWWKRVGTSTKRHQDQLKFSSFRHITANLQHAHNLSNNKRDGSLLKSVLYTADYTNLLCEWWSIFKSEIIPVIGINIKYLPAGAQLDQWDPSPSHEYLQ